MSKPKGYTDAEYLQVAANLLEQTKQRSYAFMHLQPGHRVLDVGCGPGTDTLILSSFVCREGQVVGVDHDSAMVAQANNRAEQAGVDRWVHHRHAEATMLPFETNSFDSCRSERVFEHLHHPEQALSEMVRVTRPRGWIVVLDSDWGTASTDTPDVDIERRLARFRAEACLNNGYSGRQLYRLFRNFNLEAITVEGYMSYTTSYEVAQQIQAWDALEAAAIKAGVVTADEARRYFAGLKQADQDGVFFASLSGIMLAGRKV